MFPSILHNLKIQTSTSRARNFLKLDLLKFLDLKCQFGAMNINSQCTVRVDICDFKPYSKDSKSHLIKFKYILCLWSYVTDL